MIHVVNVDPNTFIKGGFNPFNNKVNKAENVDYEDLSDTIDENDDIKQLDKL